MKFRPTVLSAASLLFIIWCIGYTLFNYSQLSEGEGWGVVGMVGLLIFGLVLLLIDFIIRWIFKDKTTINIIGAAVTIAAIFFILAEFK